MIVRTWFVLAALLVTAPGFAQQPAPAPDPAQADHPVYEEQVVVTA